MSTPVSNLSQSLLHPNHYQLAFGRVSNTIFYCTQAILPGINLPSIEQPTPWVQLPVPSNKAIFEPLVVTFLVDEAMESWNDIYTWMTGLSGEGFSNYQSLANTAMTRGGTPLYGVRPPYSDATLTVYTAKNNPQIRFQYFDCFPTSLSSLLFDNSKSADEQLIATATFRYSYYIPIPTS